MSMNLKEACKYVGDHFEYTPDRGGHWKIMKFEGDKLKGDCEDYSLTVLYYFYGSILKMLWAILKGEAKINTVMTTQGEPTKHAVGSIGKFYFDNWTYQPMSKERLVAKTGHDFKKAYNRFFVLYKLGGVYANIAIAVIPVSVIMAAIFLLK